MNEKLVKRLRKQAREETKLTPTVAAFKKRYNELKKKHSVKPGVVVKLKVSKRSLRKQSVL